MLSEVARWRILACGWFVLAIAYALRHRTAWAIGWFVMGMLFVVVGNSRRHDDG